MTVTHKVWKAVIEVLEDVHGEKDAELTPDACNQLMESVEDIENFYRGHRILKVEGGG